MSSTSDQQNKFHVTVVIPAFKEAATIYDLVGRIFAVDPEWQVIVVDDGSGDDTAQKAAQAGAEVVAHPYNLGNGAAVRSGVEAARGEVVVLMDGDGQHPPEEIPKLLELIGPYDMVVGARTKRSKVSGFRAFGNRLLIAVAQWLTGRQIPDLTSGFRAVKRSVYMQYAHLMPLSYSYPTTITIATLRGGQFVRFLPLDSITRRQGGQSNIKPFNDGLKFLHIIFRIIMTFSPMRIFLPLGGLLIAAGVVTGLYQLSATGGFRSTTVMLVLGGVFISAFGLLADQIAALRRLRK
jgi:glycosyltransferase involved in cell wall biosynthesis